MSDWKLFCLCLFRMPSIHNRKRLDTFVNKLIEANVSVERFSVIMTLANIVFILSLCFPIACATGGLIIWIFGDAT